MTDSPAARPRVLRATFDGEPLVAPAGASVAAALLASGRTGWRTTRAGAPRGLFCGIGVCFDCIVDIDGESGQRACMIPLEEGMTVAPAGSCAERANSAAELASQGDVEDLA
ncbi:2Fe-2S iron-sulfur cluster-binding protein [Leucobacter chromiireducens]|uniref:2Fe-2S iron-sulfur cluster-binding protein n=1 Tax=Leucobacter chromiireducens TaxID=283877 RepID=UPI000F63DDAC|nr:2Fe-2S iron-sulfur cluster-binding protein [Leucobacter chromiireducens]